jgi:hypothetical protein
MHVLYMLHTYVDMCRICVLHVLFSAGIAHMLNAPQVGVLSAHVQCLYVIRPGAVLVLRAHVRVHMLFVHG